MWTNLWRNCAGRQKSTSNWGETTCFQSRRSTAFLVKDNHTKTTVNTSVMMLLSNIQTNSWCELNVLCVVFKNEVKNLRLYSLSSRKFCRTTYFDQSQKAWRADQAYYRSYKLTRATQLWKGRILVETSFCAKTTQTWFKMCILQTNSMRNMILYVSRPVCV